MQELEDNEFQNVEDGAIAYFSSPPAGWAVISDCGEFPCTAPLNVLYMFKGTTWTGIRPTGTRSSFQLIANNSGFAPYIKGCTANTDMNGYWCQADKLGILLFESEDSDKYDRSMQPIYLQQ